METENAYKTIESHDNFPYKIVPELSVFFSAMSHPTKLTFFLLREVESTFLELRFRGDRNEFLKDMSDT